MWFMSFRAYLVVMKYLKSINNNIVSAIDDEGNEVILMGKGLGFNAKSSKKIDEKNIEKVFRMHSQNEMDALKNLWLNMPLEYIEVTDEIIKYANSFLEIDLNQNIYITLTDHINFAIMRYKENMIFENALLMEVRRFYKKEYLVGEYALKLIEKRLGVKFNKDEAASIAFHIINAEYNSTINETLKITRLVGSIVRESEMFIDRKIDPESIFYERFITHIKFLLQRLSRHEEKTELGIEFVNTIKNLCKDEYEFAEKIAEIIKEHQNYDLSVEDKSYIALHLKQMK